MKLHKNENISYRPCCLCDGMNIHVFHRCFLKGNNICDFLLGSLNDKAVPKIGDSVKRKNLPLIWGECILDVSRSSKRNWRRFFLIKSTFVGSVLLHLNQVP